MPDWTFEQWAWVAGFALMAVAAQVMSVVMRNSMAREDRAATRKLMEELYGKDLDS